MDLTINNACLQMLLQTCGSVNLIGIISGNWKSVQTSFGKSSPDILILAGFEQPNPIFWTVFIIGKSCGSNPTSLAQIVSQAIGSVPPISHPRGLALPFIGPGPSIAITASIIVKAGFRY